MAGSHSVCLCCWLPIRQVQLLLVEIMSTASTSLFYPQLGTRDKCQMSWKEGRRLISLMLQTKPRVCDWKCPASCRMLGPKRRWSQECQVHCEHHLLPWLPTSLALLAPMDPRKPCLFRPWQAHKNYEPEKRKKKNLSISESFVLWLFSLWAEQIPEGSSCIWPLLWCEFPKAFSLIKMQSAQQGRKWPWINPFFGCFIYCT